MNTAIIQTWKLKGSFFKRKKRFPALTVTFKKNPKNANICISFADDTMPGKKFSGRRMNAQRAKEYWYYLIRKQGFTRIK